MSLGLVAQGNSWRRAQDAAGLGIAWNGASAENRNYLAAGGLGFFIGDGRLNYGVERNEEVFYNFNLLTHVWLTANLQQITNPAYNRDRGPATFIAFRLHTEF
jgi:high affinity Mn2+ porin